MKCDLQLSWLFASTCCRNPGGAQQPFWVEWMQLVFGEAKLSRFHGSEYHGGESRTDILQTFTWVLISTWETSQGPGKLHSETFERTFTGAHTGLGIVFLPTSQSRKSYNLQGSGGNTRKVFASTVGQHFS